MLTLLQWLNLAVPQSVIRLCFLSFARTMRYGTSGEILLYTVTASPTFHSLSRTCFPSSGARRPPVTLLLNPRFPPFLFRSSLPAMFQSMSLSVNRKRFPKSPFLVSLLIRYFFFLFPFCPSANRRRGWILQNPCCRNARICALILARPRTEDRCLPVHLSQAHIIETPCFFFFFFFR